MIIPNIKILFISSELYKKACLKSNAKKCFWYHGKNGSIYKPCSVSPCKQDLLPRFGTVKRILAYVYHGSTGVAYITIPCPTEPRVTLRYTAGGIHFQSFVLVQLTLKLTIICSTQNCNQGGLVQVSSVVKYFFALNPSSFASTIPEPDHRELQQKRYLFSRPT